MKPHWKVFKKKGLELSAKKYPISDVLLTIEGQGSTESIPFQADGSWKYVHAAPLSAGRHSIHLIVKDNAGAIVVLSNAMNVTLDTAYGGIAESRKKSKKTHLRVPISSGIVHEPLRHRYSYDVPEFAQQSLLPVQSARRAAHQLRSLLVEPQAVDQTVTSRHLLEGEKSMHMAIAGVAGSTVFATLAMRKARRYRKPPP